MDIISLNKSDALDIYKNIALNDFAANELKPLAIISKLFDNGFYSCHAAFENELPAAYAFLLAERSCLIDYFAVNRSLRGKGYGGDFLSLLTPIIRNCLHSKGLILAEVENPDFAATSSDRTMRLKRINFYEKNGFVLTSIFSRVFSVEYNIICFNNNQPDALQNENIICELDRLYSLMFGNSDCYEIYEAG